MTWRDESLWADNLIDGVRFNWGLMPELVVDPQSDEWLAQDHGMIVIDPDFDLSEHQSEVYQFQREIEQTQKYFRVTVPMV